MLDTPSTTGQRQSVAWHTGVPEQLASLRLPEMVAARTELLREAQVRDDDAASVAPRLAAEKAAIAAHNALVQQLTAGEGSCLAAKVLSRLARRRVATRARVSQMLLA